MKASQKYWLAYLAGVATPLALAYRKEIGTFVKGQVERIQDLVSKPFISPVVQVTPKAQEADESNTPSEE